MLAPPSAALLLLDVTAQPTGRLQCLVRAARARPGLVDKGVSHHSCRGYTALRGRKPLNSRPCCRVADDKAALGIAAPVSAYPLELSGHDVTFRDAWAAAEPDGTPGRNLYQSQAVDKAYHVKKNV
ncbi:uncharacterized protein TrAtP1_004441 [Trichoderma atroviride]|uniref:uncharacterized protein n=1 Tax=Hypocrea atroviridis TaxID=63577 RepID=UPI00333287D7|nr:hypothetical protein TrAtP1_004441 [Trichoderma atroviride]